MFSLALAGCSSGGSISGEELHASASGYIKSLRIRDGMIVDFDANNGWYDSSKAIIEGHDVSGAYRTIAVDSVASATLPRPLYADFAIAVLSVAALLGLFFLVLLRGYST